MNSIPEYILQFPLDKPIPYDLIERIITFKVNQNHNE